jgi:hypothetical protein
LYPPPPPLLPPPLSFCAKMLPTLNIRAAVTPQMVKRRFIFIEFSSRGWIVLFFAMKRDNIRVRPLVASQTQRKEHASAGNRRFQDK